VGFIPLWYIILTHPSPTRINHKYFMCTLILIHMLNHVLLLKLSILYLCICSKTSVIFRCIYPLYVRKQNSAAISHPKSPDWLLDGSGSHIRMSRNCAVSGLVTHYRMHTSRPRNLWKEALCSARSDRRKTKTKLSFVMHLPEDGHMSGRNM
jgi:hypothetical protein